jgi:hypothetical protein
MEVMNAPIPTDSAALAQDERQRSHSVLELADTLEDPAEALRLINEELIRVRLLADAGYAFAEGLLRIHYDAEERLARRVLRSAHATPAP